MIDISKLLTFGVQQGASDCHISAGEPPMIRLHGDLKKLDHPPLTQDETHALIYDMMSDAQRKNFEEHRECDFSFDLGDIARFRVRPGSGVRCRLPDHSNRNPSSRKTRHAAHSPTTL